MFHAKSQRTQVVMTENEIAKIIVNNLFNKKEMCWNTVVTLYCISFSITYYMLLNSIVLNNYKANCLS